MIRNLLSTLKESEKVGIICDGIELKYELWYKLSKKLSDKILKIGGSKTVGIFLSNSISYAVGYFACLYADKIIAPFYIGSTMNEFLFTIEDCDISILITSEIYLSPIEEKLKRAKIPMTILVVDKWGKVKNIVSLDAVPILKKNIKEDDLKDVIILLHTSGTTSTPKRVMLTNKGLLNNILAHSKSLGFSENEVCLIQLPMVFGYCNTAQFLTHIYLKACIVINPHPFMIADFYKLVEKYRVTNFTVVPTMLTTLCRGNLLPYDITSLKVILFGGSPISQQILLEAIDKFPTISFVQTYGLTEAGPRITTMPRIYSKDKIGSVGRAISGVEIKILDDQNRNLAHGKVGEIVVKSRSLMKGYYNNPIETNKAIQEGWLYTGDIGYLSIDGYLYVLGRKKNIIISGGQNISPEEIEQVIKQSDGIVDVKVFGVDDFLLGEVVYADVVVEENSNVSIQEIKNFCLENLSRYKIPQEFNIVKNIDRTYNGKIKRKKIGGKDELRECK